MGDFKQIVLDLDTFLGQAIGEVSSSFEGSH
jgi:hypothetical protein